MQFNPKKSKYHNTKVCGYDSRKEYERANVLKLLEQQGLISDLHEQVSFVLCPAQYVDGYMGKPVCARREMKYIADFVYIEDGVSVVEDCKGFRTDEYKKKKNLMKRIYGIEIRET